MRAGIICRQDEGGLGYQTRALTYMLNPAKVMIINSRAFNGPDTPQHPEWYEGYESVTIQGFPSLEQQAAWLDGLTGVITCEIPYGYGLFDLARRRGIKIFLQLNPEFFDFYKSPQLPQPDIFLDPSPWHLERISGLYPGRVKLMPPPTFVQDFAVARKTNAARTGRRRFLHVIGKQAIHDRAGTLSVIESLAHTKADFDLVIKAQSPAGMPQVSDHRVRFDYRNPDDHAELYKDFDALIMPRRYGGLNLVMNEALMSGLPVIMTNISPNNQILPPHWLVPATKTSEFMARISIDVYSADAVALAAKIDDSCAMTDKQLQVEKANAFDIGFSHFSAEVLKPRYLELLA